MKRACLLLLVVALVGPAASLAQGPPGPHPGPHPGPPPPNSGPPESPNVQSIAAALCIAEFNQLGEAAFKAKYPTRDACMQQHAAQAAQIADSCKSAADPKACVRSAVGAPAGDRTAPAPRRDPGAALVPKVAAALCRAEHKTLGADGFKQKYSTPRACMRQMAAKAATIVKAALAKCATAENKPACVRDALGQALGLPTHAPKK